MAQKIKATPRPLDSVGVIEQSFDGDNASLAAALRGLAKYLDSDPFATVMSITVEQSEEGPYLSTLVDCYEGSEN